MFRNIIPTFSKKDEVAYQNFGHLLEGIKHYTNDPVLNQYEQNKMAILLKNAFVNYCMTHRIEPNYQKLCEAITLSTDAATFVKIQLPMIRKIYPMMIAKELVSTQPMVQPTMKIFYYDIKRDDGTSTADDIHNRRDYGDNEEYNPSSPKAIKEINLVITDDVVEATEKKIKERHTIEAEQDIYAYHGINIDSDLTNALSLECAMEWDRVILQALLDGATGGSATFDQTIPVGITYEDASYWAEGLYHKMCDVDTAIFKKRKRRTNWVVLSADIANFVDKMAGFKADATGSNFTQMQTGGRYFMGTLNNRWRVYCDSEFPSNKLLMGYNGTDWKDTAAVWCPYVLSYFSDPFVDPNTFVKTRAILSRAAFKVVVGDLLGVVTVTGS